MGLASRVWGRSQAALLALVAGACLVGAVGLAGLHPVAPFALSLALLLVTLAVGWRPQLAWFLLPALLPVMNFSPWTGWWLIDESDLLVLACLAGGYGRCALDQRAVPVASPHLRGWVPLWCLLAISLALGVWWGLNDAGFSWAGAQAALYAGYDSAWNTVRVAKSLFWALSLGGLMRSHAAVREPASCVARGMVAGLSLVCAAALWERGVYAGLLDFSLPYRSSAWFWEMHVGGGAIDAYLAMAVPFAFWAVWTAPTAWRWAAANVLLAVSVYTLLTTFSRGVYLAVLISLLWMAVSAWHLKLEPAAGATWGRRTLGSMLLVLGLEAALVFGGGTFMADRLSRSDVDMVGRLTHWSSGLDLLKTPGDWATGLGLGRFPAHYSRAVEGGGYPGQAIWQRDPTGRAHVLLSGPTTNNNRVGLFALTQRVEIGAVGGHRVRLRAHSAEPVDLVVSVCERHLLYEFRCQSQWIAVAGSSQAGGEAIEVKLEGDAFDDREPLERLRQGVLAIAPAQAASAIRLDSVELFDEGGQQVLRNDAFTAGLQHWFPMALGQFEPWHIDNLYLDVLIERGLSGLLVLAIWVIWAGAGLWRGRHHTGALAWVLSGSILGMLSLGAVISVTEVPRVALILMILLWSSGAIRGQIEDVSRCNRL
jgi:hypothetical protein